MDVDDDAVSVRGGKGKKKSAWKRGKQGESSLFSSISRMLPRNMNMYVKFGVSTHSSVGGGGVRGLADHQAGSYSAPLPDLPAPSLCFTSVIRVRDTLSAASQVSFDSLLPLLLRVAIATPSP